MSYRRRALMPRFPPFHPETGVTADPGLVVESTRFTDVLALRTSALWQAASLTQDGREVAVQAFREGWIVRRPSVRPPFKIVPRYNGGSADPCAIIVRLWPHTMRGRLVSATPERARLEPEDRCIVVTSDRLIAVRGADPAHAFGYLADVLVGTHRAPRRRARPIPAADAEALRSL